MRQTLLHITIVLAFLSLCSFMTTKLLTLLPVGLQPSVFMLFCLLYWLALDNVTFATDLTEAEMASERHRAAEAAAIKIAIGAVAAAAGGDDNKRLRSRGPRPFNLRK